jgi:hypothetical protein
MKRGGTCAMQKGNRLCGRISYEINGPPDEVRNCHCSTCRKAHSAALRSRANVGSRDFRWTSGENPVTWYRFSAGTQRGFCSRCGSSPPSRFDDSPEVFGFPLGCLDTDPGVGPAMHLFVGSKAAWFEITDLLPRHEAGPPR